MSEELFEAYARNELDAEERLRLKRRLENEPAVRAAFAQHMLQRSALISAMRTQGQLQHQGESGQHRLAQTGRPRRHRQHRRRSSGRHAFRIAAGFLLLVGIGALVFMVRSPAQAPVAIAEQGSAVLLRDGKELPLVEQRQLVVGDEIAIGGAERVDLRFADGSRISLFAGSVRLDAWQQGKRLRLRHGVITADVAKQADAPLRITGSRCEATILGTSFSMREADGWADLQVEHGLVRYERLSDGASLEVGAGRRAHSAPGVVWAVFEQGRLPVSRLRLADGRIDPGSAWRVVDDPSSGGPVLACPADAELGMVNGITAGAPVRLSCFLEAGATYTLWIHGRHIPSSEDPTHTDQVFVQLPGASWNYDYERWRAAAGWDFLPAEPELPMVILNGWATYAPDGSWCWVAGAASKGDIGVPERLTFTVERSGIHELSIHPTAGPTRVSEIYITAGDERPMQ